LMHLHYWNSTDQIKEHLATVKSCGIHSIWLCSPPQGKRSWAPDISGEPVIRLIWCDWFEKPMALFAGSCRGASGRTSIIRQFRRGTWAF
jgi:hypothetical protein